MGISRLLHVRKHIVSLLVAELGARVLSTRNCNGRLTVHRSTELHVRTSLDSES